MESQSASAMRCECGQYGRITALREQIKSNAGLLFPHASNVPAGPQFSYDVVIMAYTADAEITNAKKLQYEAVLVYNDGYAGTRKGAAAARGQPSSDSVGALEGLLLVTATALAKFRGDVWKDVKAPLDVAGGVVDEALIHGSSRKGLFGIK